MKHNITKKQGAVIISFEGDMDLQHSPQARKALLDCVKSKKPLMVDMSKVTYIDSSGVASLVEALQTARKNNCDFSLISISDATMRVLKLARLDSVFSIYDSLEDALAGIKQA